MPNAISRLVTPGRLLLAATPLAVTALVAVPSSPIARAAIDAPAIQAPTASFAELVAAVEGAVVNISTRGEVDMQPAVPEAFRQFFGRGGMPAKRETRSLGSGFVVDGEGHIVTNRHVVEHATEVTVITSDGTEYEATVKGTDPRTDLAVLKIESDAELPHLAWGDDRSARPGDWAVAIGNPFGLGGSVSTGVISARGRNINAGPYDDFIQIDAAINSGNSGGPLFDTQGRVIGVNTAIFSPNGGSVGIGFAIPSHLAKPVVAQLIADGRVERGWLGVELQQLTDALANGLELSATRGALVASVLPEGPAARAGLEAGDVILKLGDAEVDDSRALGLAVAGVKPGTRAPVTVWRGGKERTLKVQIGEMPQDTVASAPARDDSDASEPQLGLQLAPLAPELRYRLGLPENASGALVAGVAPSSPAARAGLQRGDLITRIDKTDVSQPRDVARHARDALAAGKRTLLLRVNRGGQERFIALEAEPA